MKAKNIIFTIIRIVLVAALIFAVIFFVFQTPPASEKPVEEVAASVAPLLDTEKMEKNSLRFFKKLYGLNAEDFDGVVIYTPVSSMDAEEMLLVKLKDASREEELKKAIEDRAATKLAVFEGYAPEQYSLAEKYILDSRSGYVLFVISKDAELIDNAFKNAL